MNRIFYSLISPGCRRYILPDKADHLSIPEKETILFAPACPETVEEFCSDALLILMGFHHAGKPSDVIFSYLKIHGHSACSAEGARHRGLKCDPSAVGCHRNGNLHVYTGGAMMVKLVTTRRRIETPVLVSYQDRQRVLCLWPNTQIAKVPIAAIEGNGCVRCESAANPKQGRFSRPWPAFMDSRPVSSPGRPASVSDQGCEQQRRLPIKLRLGASAKIMKLSVAASDRTHELGQALRRQVAMDRGTVGCNWLRFRRRSAAGRRVQSEAEYGSVYRRSLSKRN